jgi:hypothetical protein
MAALQQARLAEKHRNSALFNLTIDSKLRSAAVGRRRSE